MCVNKRSKAAERGRKKASMRFKPHRFVGGRGRERRVKEGRET